MKNKARLAADSEGGWELGGLRRKEQGWATHSESWRKDGPGRHGRPI